MLARSMSIAMALAMSVVLGSEAGAARPVEVLIVPVTLPNVLVSGELDFESEGVQAIALVEQYYKRGLIEVHIEAYADVLNASGKKIKVTDPTEFILFGGPEVIVKKFSYTVSKSGQATLKAVFLTDTFLGPVGI